MSENKKLEIELSPEMADGTYANLAVISSSPSEFVLDFIGVMPNTAKARVKSRVIMTPDHAKRLMHALQEHINGYEQKNGPIKDNHGHSGNAMPPLTMFGTGGEA